MKEYEKPFSQIFFILPFDFLLFLFLIFCHKNKYFSLYLILFYNLFMKFHCIQYHS